MGLREQKKQQTRQRLLAVAATLFDQAGFQATTVDEIAAQANISRMTFFNYFASKEKVLEALAIDWLNHHSALFEIMIGGEGTPEAVTPPELTKRLDVIIKHRKFLKMVVQHSQLFNNFSASSETPDPSVTPYMASHFQNRLTRVREAQQQGSVRSDIEATEICHLYDAMRNDIVGRWLMDDDATEKQLRKRFSGAMRLFLSGLKEQGNS
ncbi:TetR/AcrR family transcriptional regulator [Oceanicoccus sp. KOV_DT_Chl]|uniref:TetR/AcrR family transcriptional regulator n=1 Tax=Oceanicoccus sp. KOV_DT_Chl TaxID=1904639 RepID=UPI000C7ABBA9|nr:TetR/AcrR family transcriptional regulator [Oceanicoccus sp. KOV_DT_Chl]